MDKNYIILSPVRNEEQYVEKTILSVLAQTIIPAEWIIIDDGSTDSTSRILEKYNRKLFIKVIKRSDRGYTNIGKGVMEAFNDGIKNIQTSDWDYIVKLDCDLELEREYFEKLLLRFETESLAGILGGTTYIKDKSGMKEEKVPESHPMAAARMYRRKCFEDIGGLQITLGWDMLDLLQAQIAGWKTIRLPELKIKHFRQMSSRDGLWAGKVRTGKIFYKVGYHPIFLIARSFYRMTQSPYLIETFGVIYGYFKAMLQGENIIVSLRERKFLRRQQIGRLVRFNL